MYVPVNDASLDANDTNDRSVTRGAKSRIEELELPCASKLVGYTVGRSACESHLALHLFEEAMTLHEKVLDPF